MTRRPRVLLNCGYFDWFSGYQETALAHVLSRIADVEVVAADRVSPIFEAGHLRELGVSRRYSPGTTDENGVTVTRFGTGEQRGMVWSRDAVSYISGRQYDVIVQVMPGQILPAAGSIARTSARRLVLYGDNAAMWAHLPEWKRKAKGIAFASSKGLLYRFVNSRADLLYGYTPNTVTRLGHYAAGKRISILPLAYDADQFSFDQETRMETRQRMSYDPSDRVVIAAGKVVPQKRLDLLLRAFRSLAEQIQSARLLVVGIDDSSHSLALKALVERDPILKSRVRLTPFVAAGALNQLFNAADVGVWPRMPAITIQQAMGTGLKVALPKNDLVGHLLRLGSGDYFVPRDDGDWQSLEESLRSLVRGSPDSDTDARRQRCVTNSWLSADAIARSLLADAGWGQQPQPSVSGPNGEAG